MANKVSNLSHIFTQILPNKNPGEKAISYSQFSMWATCPHKWKLTYIDKHKMGRPSIHTVFGSAFHETMQWYLHNLFSHGAKVADNLNLNELLQEQMVNNYALSVSQNNDEHFSTKAELEEFYTDGVAILEWFIKHRSAYFTNRGYELIGIEIPLYVSATPENEKVIMSGFIDFVLRDVETDRIKVYDIKTSTRGWNATKKADKLTASQLVLYKHYFAKQFGYDEEKVDIEYFIVKRKLIDGFMYPQKRVQSFIPASGKPTRNKLIKEISAFIKAGFKEDGTYNVEGEFPAVSEKGKNCKYCEFANNETLCPKANRI